MMKFLILMATYNGADYIDQQIESIINQTWEEWDLIIRDDGSSDGTVKIIQSYIKKDSRIHLLENRTGKHGAYLNFWTLIDYAHSLKKYDYYCFSDQDDIWLENKLDAILQFAGNLDNKEKPVLIYSDMEVIDGDNHKILSSVNSAMGNGSMKGFSLFFSHGFIWGCSAIINRKLFDAVPGFPLDDKDINIMSHDNYYGKIALSIGSVEFLNEPLIQHRRHESNKTGSYEMKLSLLHILRKILFQYDDLAKTHALVYSQSLLTIRQMQNAGITSQKFELIKEAIYNGGIRGIRILKKMGVQRKQLSRTAGIYIVMGLKSYKKYLIM